MRTRRARRGANAIEFALTFTFGFVPIVFGMMEFGYLFTQRSLISSTVATSCREGALIDGKNSPIGGCVDDGCIEAVTKDLMETRIEGIGLTCDSCVAEVYGVFPQKAVECTAIVPHRDITGFFRVFFPDRLQIRAASRLEWQRPE